MATILENLVSYLHHQFSFLWRPEHGLFVGYLLSAFIVAVLHSCVHLKSLNIIKSAKNVISVHDFRSRSAFDDVIIFVVDKLFLGFTYTYLLGFAIYTRSMTLDALAHVWPSSARTDITTALSLLVAFGALVVFDFATFIEHFIAHKVPFFWEFHKVHHVPKELNPFTAYRSHPVNQGMFVIIAGGLSGVYYGIVGSIFKGNQLSFIFAGQNIFMFLLLVSGLNLQHSHIQLIYPRIIRAVFVSPAYHQLHHSSADSHHNKNFGFIFSFWDRLFGTQIQVTKPINLEFGLDRDEYADYSGVVNHYLTPLKRVKRLLSYAWQRRAG
jgi:sterol desaturase/sphingolipid hydroxylase (fatty acid hydroxylase superfamily)